jgi:hypothetical protein
MPGQNVTVFEGNHQGCAGDGRLNGGFSVRWEIFRGAFR